MTDATEPNRIPPAMDPRPSFHVKTILFLIAIGSVLTQGYLVGQINHGFQLALVRLFAGETAWVNDAFLQGMARTYTTGFFPALGMFARVVPLEAVLLTFFLIFRIACIFLAYRLALVLFRSERAALWTAAASSVHLLTFAMDIVSENYLTHGALAQVMTLGALVLLAEGKLIRAFVVAGLMYNVHAMHATHLIFVMGMAVITGHDRRAQLVPLAKAAVLTVVAALPTLFWMVHVHVLFSPIADPTSYVDAIKSWFPTHFWPSTWSLTDWISFLFPALAAWPLGHLAGRTSDGGRIARVAALSIVFAVIGGAATEIMPSPFLIRLHPMRLSFIACLAGVPFFAQTAARLLRPEDDERLASIPRESISLGIFLLLGVAMPLAYRWDYLLVLVPALWGMALHAARNDVRALQVAAPLTLATAIAIPILLVWDTHTEVSLRSHGLRFFLIEGSCGLIAAISFALARGTETKGPPTVREKRLTIRLAGGIALFHLVLTGAYLFHYGWWGGLHRWREVQIWCGEHLDPGERVLVPLTEIGLRAFSKQTPAVDFQEGDILFHEPEYMDTFFDKLRLYGWTPGRPKGWEFVSKLDELDDALSKADLLRIGAALDARVSIRRKHDARLDLLVLFENQDFIVYALDGRAR
jgi:hypothetical protein